MRRLSNQSGINLAYFGGILDLLSLLSFCVFCKLQISLERREFVFNRLRPLPADPPGCHPMLCSKNGTRRRISDGVRRMRLPKRDRDLTTAWALAYIF